METRITKYISEWGKITYKPEYSVDGRIWKGFNWDTNIRGRGIRAVWFYEFDGRQTHDLDIAKDVIDWVIKHKQASITEYIKYP